MSKKVFCDGCGKEFSKRDDYIDGKVEITCNQYCGDDGTNVEHEGGEFCEKCVWKILRFLYQFKENKGDATKISWRELG